MARPASGANLSIADLKRVLDIKTNELGKLHQQRRTLQKKMNVLDRQIERIGGDPVKFSARGSNGYAGGRAKNETNLLDSIENVLKHAGKPLKVGDIMEGVLSSGYRSGSSNFRGIVNQTLIKDKRFGQVERGTYELKKPREKATAKD